MSRTCSVCTHSEREAIDRALVEGAAYRDVAGRYGLSKSAVMRHKRDHLAERLRQADAEGQLTAAKLLRDLAELQARALGILNKAERARDLRGALAGVREVRACIEATAKLLETGELEERIEALEEAMERGG